MTTARRLQRHLAHALLAPLAACATTGADTSTEAADTGDTTGRPFPDTFPGDTSDSDVDTSTPCEATYTEAQLGEAHLDQGSYAVCLPVSRTDPVCVGVIEALQQGATHPAALETRVHQVMAPLCPGPSWDSDTSPQVPPWFDTDLLDDSDALADTSWIPDTWWPDTADTGARPCRSGIYGMVGACGPIGAPDTCCFAVDIALIGVPGRPFEHGTATAVRRSGWT